MQPVLRMKPMGSSGTSQNNFRLQFQIKGRILPAFLHLLNHYKFNQACPSSLVHNSSWYRLIRSMRIPSWSQFMKFKYIILKYILYLLAFMVKEHYVWLIYHFIKQSAWLQPVFPFSFCLHFRRYLPFHKALTPL